MTIAPSTRVMGTRTGAAGPAQAPLPYGPVMTRLLEPLRSGFRLANSAFMAPALRAGLGRLMSSPVTGNLMLVRTRGRRTGLPRDVPLGYLIRDGAIYCVAGYGRRSPWYLNVLDSPTVEVILPGRRIRGVAETVVDDVEWLATYRALIRSFGIVGRLTSGRVARADDATLLATHRVLPLVRIRSLEPAGPLEAGRWDPGGNGWLVSHGLMLGVFVVLAAIVRLSAKGHLR